nr:aquaporin [Agriphila aeneociliella]
MPRDVSDENGRGVAAWVKRSWRALVAELISTALLVLLGVATLMTGVPVPLTHPALAFGFVVLVNVEAFGPASGAHMNPAVTLAALLYGKIRPLLAAAYLVAQVVGALVGFGLLSVLAPPGLAANAGCTATALPPAAAAAVEALLTGTLVLLCGGLWAAHDDDKPDRAASIKLGCAIAGLVYAGGHLTGASLNPARSLAPALVQGFWENHWVYWVGPLGGAALAALLHRFVLRAPRPTPAGAPRAEALPLQDKADLA